jgi:uncharacterized membrane protein YjfL (UPF0719 family)
MEIYRENDTLRRIPVTMLVNVIVELIQLILAIVLAVVSLYAGFFAFNRIVKGINVPSELTRGNKAIGLFVASVFIGISVTVVSCVQGVLIGLNKIFADGALNLNDTLDVVSSCLELVLGILLAIGSIYLAIYVFSHMFRRDIITAIENGNAAIACTVGGMIIAVSVIIHYGVLGIVTAVF